MADYTFQIGDLILDFLAICFLLILHTHGCTYGIVDICTYMTLHGRNVMSCYTYTSQTIRTYVDVWRSEKKNEPESFTLPIHVCTYVRTKTRRRLQRFNSQRMNFKPAAARPKILSKYFFHLWNNWAGMHVCSRRGEGNILCEKFLKKYLAGSV